MKRAAKRPRPKGRHSDASHRDALLALLPAPPWRRDLLIEYLHCIQDHHGHLPADALTALADILPLSLAEVYEVASFYHHFDLPSATPPPALTLRICNSLSCSLQGAEALRDTMQKRLDGQPLRLQMVPCIGRCATAPAAVLGQCPIDNATAQSLQQALEKGDTEAPLPPYQDLASYRQAGGYRQLQQVQQLPAEQRLKHVTGLLEDAHLRGLGGAGFPLARKWRIVSQQPAPRLMAVNIDEGEPGTFKDRHCLESAPHHFLEGMLIAATVVGIDKIYLYLRDEYAAGRAVLTKELAALRADAPIPLPPMELRRGAGAYICGEESAMIESIEGKRGMPRLRPPYIAEIGLFGRPTLEHNLESLHFVPLILEKGSAWFAQQGRRGRQGLRHFSLSGRIQKPGVYLAPAGISLHELIAEYGGGMMPGHRLRAFLPGGASGGILPPQQADLPLDFDTLQEHGCFIGSAAIIVLSDHDNLRAAVHNLLRFFAAESCGKCTPCRVGTEKMQQLMAEPQWNLPLLRDLATVMRDASICGLGQAAPNPFDCLLRYFPEEFPA